MPRGRSPGFKMPEAHRTKIGNSQILNRLMKCALGELELNPVQASIGMGLLRKVLPDLQSVELSGNADQPIIHEIRQLIVEPGRSDG